MRISPARWASYARRWSISSVDTPQPSAPPLDTEALVGQAIQNRPELADLRLRYQAARKFEAAREGSEEAQCQR